jgi:hypothetical protein
MRIIVLQHQLVDIDLADTPSNTALGDFIRETVGAMQHDADAAGDLFADCFESAQFVSSATKGDRCTRPLRDGTRLTWGNPAPAP